MQAFNRKRISGFSAGCAFKDAEKSNIYGKIKYKDELYDGQHKAIISPKIFESVQYILKNKEKSERTCLFNKMRLEFYGDF